jgi:glycerol-3-phosphate dehydrogenase
MIRDFGRLNSGPFDVLVIGGGIYGAWTALDATLRGLKVAVIDKGDWACGTSMASTKLIHGGLRYLEHLRLDLVHSSLEERRQLTAMAPHRVVPLRFFIPNYDSNRVGPIKLQTGLWLYDLMAGKGQPVPAHTRLKRRDALAQYSFLKAEAISGGFTYGDCQTDDFRLVLDVIDGAQRAGAVALNYAKAVSLISKGRHVEGAVVQDLLTGTKTKVQSKVVINTAGPWAPFIDDIHLLASYIRYSKGIHLILPPLPTKDALLLMTRSDKRIFFIVPWYGKSLLGTTDGEFEGHPDSVRIEDFEVDYLLTEANRHLKSVTWDRRAVLGGFVGLRTLQNEPGKPLSQVTREWSVIEPRPGLLVSIGGKYTSARLDAAKIVARLLDILNRPTNTFSPTAGYTLPSTPRADYKAWRKTAMQKALKSGLKKDMATFLTLRFGDALPNLLVLIDRQPELARRLVPELPFCWAEVVYCASNEMVVHLEDLLRRRIPLTILSRPDRSLAEQIAAKAAPHLGWSQADSNEEVAHLMSRWIDIQDKL